MSRFRPSSSSRGMVPLVLLAVTLLLVACAGGSDRSAEPTVTDDGALRLVGQDDLRWNVEELTTDAGVVEFELVCEDAVNHNIVIDELDAEVAACAPGATSRGSIQLDPGTYTYVCTVPGHEGTMRGTLTVE
ncbi:MAG: plastocyanin/azurin family copper-binding protein [Nitriliruptoraceae bacterium]